MYTIYIIFLSNYVHNNDWLITKNNIKLDKMIEYNVINNIFMILLNFLICEKFEWTTNGSAYNPISMDQWVHSGTKIQKILLKKNPKILKNSTKEIDWLEILIYIL